MRLQLLIQRHALPPVTIIHTTGTGPSSHTKSRSSTVADLLSDVNDLVPLESSDGEWGLEDYVVEVAATVDQELTYECLHFQNLKSVLREDDEVLIRALSNDDLRVRRLGGRHQITGDGRHLVDGIAFGKRWLRQTTRPGIVIPPRKKRRLLPEEDVVLTTEEDVKRLSPAGAEVHHNNIPGALVPFLGDEDDEDNEDDDDYLDKNEGDAHDHIIISEEFDDADADQDDEFELDDLETAALPSEIQQLLEDAAEIEQTSNLAIAGQVLEKQLKRKRTIQDDGEHEHQELIFEGFSTTVDSSSLPLNGSGPGLTNGVSDADSDNDGGSDSLLDEMATLQEAKRAKNILEDDDDDDDEDELFDETTALQEADRANNVSEDDDDDSDSLLDEISAQQESKRAKNIVQDDDDDSDDSDATSSSETSSSDSEDESGVGGTEIQQAKQRVLSLIRNSETSKDEDETSTSGSDTDDEVSDTTSSLGPESDADDTSESGSDASSESASESEEDSAKQNAIKEKKVKQPPGGQQATIQPPAQLKDITNKASAGIPFEGKTRTQQNNERGKRRKRLASLKNQGLLPQEADFQALAKYEEEVERGVDGVKIDQEVPVADQQADDAIMKDASILNQDAETSAGEAVTEVNEENVKPQDDDDALVGEPAAEKASAVPEIPETSRVDSQSMMESAPKRARLDLTSSRRLIFGSLGVRTPKNAEQEQKLRETLSQNIRQLKQVKDDRVTAVSETSQPTAAPEEDNDSWKNNLVVFAVECEEPGGILPPPPFPFEQGWAKPNKNKRKMRDQSQYYQGRSDWPREKDEHAPAPDVTTLNYDDDVSQTNDPKAPPKANGGTDDLPSEKEIENLPSLEPTKILPGATIAYQELHIDAATNYEPAVSPFRVGQVSQVDEDGTVHLQLAKSLLNPQAKGTFDKETGERIYGKFEMAIEDADEEDDGTRDISFSNMIKPKLVKSASIQVPDSSHAASLRGGEAPISSFADEVSMVPESAEQDVEPQATQETAKLEMAMSTIDTPRKQEINGIIKEAGFESALDEQLLQPIVNPISDDVDDTLTQGDEQDESPEKYAHRFRRRSPRVIITSSDPQPSSIVEDEVTFHDEPADAGPEGDPSVPATSSPYMPTLNTVDYPHISQMEINSSAPVRTTNSSSHQDAQKLSPAPAWDLSFTISEPEKPTDEDPVIEAVDPAEDDVIEVNRRKPSPALMRAESPFLAAPEASSLAEEPEIEQTQFPQVTSDILPSSPIPTPDNEGSSVQRNSFLGAPGYDGGNDSSYHDSLDDNSSLPSLSDMIPGQRPGRRTSRRTGARSTKKKASPPALPPARKSARTVNVSKRRKKSPTPPSSPELPSSQIEFKASQSQKSQPRLSQIPEGSQFVDLIFSSDPLSPIRSPKKWDDDEEEEGEYTVSRNKNKNKIEVKSTSRKAISKAASKQTSQDSGIGKRTLLTKKRSSDNKYY